ncbi:MAG: helix-turn-helix domain-containing protein [Cellvibrionaceae bacterium]
MDRRLIIDEIINDISVEYDMDFFIKRILITIFNKIKNYDDNPFNLYEVSSAMNLSERTFHRKLNMINKSYMEVKNEARKKYSIYLLSSESYTINQISKFLFFKNTSAFIHSFKRWYGCTPKKWRSVVS